MSFIPRKKRLLIVTLTGLLVTLILAFVFVWRSAEATYLPYYLHRTRIVGTSRSSADSISITHIRLRVNDTTTLAMLKVEPKFDPTFADVVMVHGYRSNKEAMLGGALWLSKRGVTVWLPDLRAHGESDGTFTTLGAKEHQELLVVVDSIMRWGRDRPIALWGNSMGGATVLLTAASDPRIDLCVSESAFADVHTLLSGFIDHEFPDDPTWKRWLGPCVIARELNMALGEADPVDVINKISCPLALVHGTADTRVPFAHAERLLQASNGHATLITIPGGTHYNLRLSAPAVYDRGLGPLFDALIAQGRAHM